MDKNALQQIILDFQDQELDPGITRHVQYEIFPNKAFVCIGVRRCGKSTLLYQIITKLLYQGEPIENIVYLNFFDDRLWELKKGGIGTVIEAYYALYPEKKKSEKVYYFFDEIQEAKDWEPFIDRLLRTENCEVYLSGSSAKMLSKEISTQMRGRSLTWELFPFSFKEFLDARQVKYHPLNTRNRLIIQKACDDYFRNGGFPETLSASKRIRIMLLQEYYKAILHRDIIERFDALHPKAVIDTGYRLISSVASFYSVNKLTDYLKSLGHKVSKSFVGQCIEWFEDAYFLFSVKRYSISVNKQNINLKKVYCIDQGMVQAVTSMITQDRGHLLENMVFLHLRRQGFAVWYYRTKNGKEVDFIWLDKDRKKHLAQVCWTLKNEKTKHREVTSLLTTLEEQQIESALIITHDENETLQTGNIPIEIIPAWKFLMENTTSPA
ncbi:ATPase family protein [delta proteobacterium NaphS2]|nr:ATPase family protein [delta proteobacterium NaphS2]